MQELSFDGKMRFISAGVQGIKYLTQIKTVTKIAKPAPYLKGSDGPRLHRSIPNF